jgi:hypothetical protein
MSKVKLFSNPTNSVRLTLNNADQRNVSFLDFIKESCPSLYGEKAVYHPTSYLFNGHLQTGFAAYYNKSPTTKEVVYERFYY